MKRLSGALVIAVLLAPSQTSATPITFRDIAADPLIAEESAGGSRFAAFSGFGSAGASVGLSGSGMSSQRSGLGESGWFSQNRGNGPGEFTNTAPGLIQQLGSNDVISHLALNVFGSSHGLGRLVAGLEFPPTPTPGAPGGSPSVTAVPEPSTVALLAIGLTVTGIRRSRRKSSTSLSLQ